MPTCRRCAQSVTARRGRISKANWTSHALREQGIAATRQLAKRQLTWLRSWPDAVTLDCLASDLEAQAFARVERFLA